MQALLLCLVTAWASSQDELRELERLAAQLERRIEDLASRSDGERDSKLKEELGRARKELEWVRREIRALQGEQDPRGQRERELKELIDELEEAIEREKNEEQRRLLKEDLSLAKRELDELRGKGPRGGRSPKGPPPSEDPFLQWLRRNHPEILEKVMDLRVQKRLEEAEQVLRQARARFPTEGSEAHPPSEATRIAELEEQSLRLADRIRAERDRKERARLGEELKALLGKLFDMKEAVRRREIEDLARQVEELKAQLKRRQEGRDKIIEARLRQLLGEQEGWDW